jgi:hypothetical protein
MAQEKVEEAPFQPGEIDDWLLDDGMEEKLPLFALPTIQEEGSKISNASVGFLQAVGPQKSYEAPK